MKKIFFLILAFAIVTVSCSKLFDIKPTDAISSDVAILNKVGVKRALIGSYNALQATGLYGRNQVIIGDLAADNLVWTGTSQDYGQISAKPIPADNSIIDGMWSAAYDGINRVNNILYQLPSIGDLSKSESKQFESEALFIRALLYFKLTSYFGDVPLRILPTLDLSKIDMEKSSTAKTLDQVIADLSKAVQNYESVEKTEGSLPKITGFANKWAVKALRAKVWLTKFHQTGSQAYADSAVVDASDVILKGGFQLENVYKNLYSNSSTSSESIFEVVYDLQNYNRLAQYFYSRNLIGRYEVAPDAAFIQSYEAADQRFSASITYDDKNKPYVIKYNDVAGGTDRVYVLRLADMYLIRAEALAYANGEILSIQNDINAIRYRAGLLQTPAETYTALKLAIENERRHEFAFEGQRWNDLVRTKRATDVLGISDKNTLFPIPLSELQTNNKMTPNP